MVSRSGVLPCVQILRGWVFGLVFAVGFLLVPSQGFERLWGSVFADFAWCSGFLSFSGFLGLLLALVCLAFVAGLWELCDGSVAFAWFFFPGVHKRGRLCVVGGIVRVSCLCECCHLGRSLGRVCSLGRVGLLIVLSSFSECDLV